MPANDDARDQELRTQVVEPERIRRTCLVADDDPAIRRVLELAVARCGLELKGFGTAHEVLEACRQAPPDILFLDLALKGSDAIEVIRALSALRFRGAVQLISGHHALLDDVRNVGEQHGLMMLPPLPKPFRAAQVEEIIQTRLPAQREWPGQARP